MSLPADLSIVLELAGVQWLVKKGQLVKLDSLTDVKGPKAIVTDFGESLTRVDTVSSSKQYAEAIIEKSLRDQGDTDGASKILIVDSETNANTTRALFTAVSAEQFAQYWRMASQHGDHCLLIPISALMLRLAKSQGKKGCHAVVLQYGQHIDMLLTENGRARSHLRVSSSSMEEDDWQRSIIYLAAEMQQIVADQGQELVSVSWVDWNPTTVDVNALQLQQKLSDALGSSLQPLAISTLKHEQEQIETALPALIKMASSADAINSSSDKSLFFIERSLPWVAGLLLAFSGALVASGIYWQDLAGKQQQQADILREGLNNEQLNLMQKNTAAYKQSFDAGQKADYAFVEKMQQAVALPSIATMMNDVHQATPKGVKISLLALEQNAADISAMPSAYIVEGRVFKALSATNTDIETMSHKLSELGYHVQDNGLTNKENSHIFQLVLTMGN